MTNRGTLPTHGTVQATVTLPNSFRAKAISGYGWSCSVATLSCMRSDALGAGAGYPPITLIVSVESANSPVTSTATVSGGGEINTENDTTKDLTYIAQYKK